MLMEGRYKEAEGRAGIIFFSSFASFRKLLFSVKMYFTMVKFKKFPQTSVAAHLPQGRRIGKAMGMERSRLEGPSGLEGLWRISLPLPALGQGALSLCHLI